MINPSKKRSRTDIYSPKKRSAIMGLIRGKDTLLEIELRKLLRREGLRFGTNVKKLAGKPDIVFKNKKLVVFIDGCFWHGCKKHFKLPKSNKSFWEIKIIGNAKRDAKINKYYRAKDWRVFRVWEHQLKTNPSLVVRKIIKLL